MGVEEGCRDASDNGAFSVRVVELSEAIFVLDSPDGEVVVGLESSWKGVTDVSVRGRAVQKPYISRRNSAKLLD